ncbi:MAG TPA: hypothetical protein VK892_16360 [Pyrinomonadaceae bacterium]|nr:hypothetical protein [Pyrinomonadaceae bacterium]
MEKSLKSKNGSSANEEKEVSSERKVPIIETLKPKKRYTKLEKELIEATIAAMDVLIKQKNAQE